MRLSKKFDYSLIALMLALTGLVFLETAYNPQVKTFAESEDYEIVAIKDSIYVTIHDDGKRTIIKTTPGKTVREILEKMNVIINSTDSVEPGMDEIVDADNYHINIYRSYPAMVIDGGSEKYIMTSSHDPKSIVMDAGITVYDGDEIELVTDDRFLEVGVAPIYRLIRNGGRNVTIEEEIPFEETKVKDFDLAPGEMAVRQPGELGRKEKVYNVLYVDGEEVERTLVSERVIKEPVTKITAIGASKIEQRPLTPSMGRNYYTTTGSSGQTVERQETYYDLDMSGVMSLARGWEGCSHSGHYSVREDGAKVDDDGYVLVAANLGRYPRCSVVETSLGAGKIYDTGTFAAGNPEQFDLATDWTNRNGR